MNRSLHENGTPPGLTGLGVMEASEHGPQQNHALCHLPGVWGRSAGGILPARIGMVGFAQASIRGSGLECENWWLGGGSGNDH